LWAEANPVILAAQKSRQLQCRLFGHRVRVVRDANNDSTHDLQSDPLKNKEVPCR
jgi:hypothetical protein